MTLIDTPELRQRLTYKKPFLKEFGLIVDLTANGSGAVSEQGPGGGIACAKSKQYSPVCGGAG
jgi:hypothetical protein